MDIDKEKIEIAKEQVLGSVANGSMYPNTGRLLNELLNKALNMRIVNRSTKIKLDEIFEIEETGHLYKYELCENTSTDKSYNKYYTFVRVEIR